jgi:hypothetical protein
MQHTAESGDRAGRRRKVWLAAVMGSLAITTLLVIAAARLGSGDDWSANLLSNASFEDVSGLRQRPFGFTGDLPGWTTAIAHPVELVADGVMDMPAADGDYWLDMGQARAKIIDISQRVKGLDAASPLRLVFHAGQWRTPSAPPDETLNVYWGGELLANVRPETIGGYETFEFELTAGAGDGSDTIRFEGVSDGSADSQGVALDHVGLFALDPGSRTTTEPDTGSGGG